MILPAPVILTPAPSIAIGNHWLARQGLGQPAGKCCREKSSSSSVLLGKQVTNQGGQAYTLVNWTGLHFGYTSNPAQLETFARLRVESS